MLCKFSWTTSKIRAMGNRSIENRVRGGMPVYCNNVLREFENSN